MKIKQMFYDEYHKVTLDLLSARLDTFRERARMQVHEALGKPPGTAGAELTLRRAGSRNETLVLQARTTCNASPGERGEANTQHQKRQDYPSLCKLREIGVCWRTWNTCGRRFYSAVPVDIPKRVRSHYCRMQIGISEYIAFAGTFDSRQVILGAIISNDYTAVAAGIVGSVISCQLGHSPSNGCFSIVFLDLLPSQSVSKLRSGNSERCGRSSCDLARPAQPFRGVRADDVRWHFVRPTVTSVRYPISKFF